MADKGITWVEEKIRGFVGSLKQTTTRENRECLLFDLASGENKPQLGKFPVWRHCIAYGEKAIELWNMKIGDLVNVEGWLTANPVRGTDGKPTYRAGIPITREYVIVEVGYIVERDNIAGSQQLSMVGVGG